MNISESYMSRCIDLASHGAGSVAPNPMVGSVIVHDNLIIGEGYHRCYGEAHAEVNAIASVKDESLLKNSTLYVNLEPCSHYGKTPPCAELIIQKGIPRVVIACLDPFAEVSGRGIKMLCDAGVEVVTGVMENEATELNRYFITAHKKRRPYIILKWAQSEDGFIDRIRSSASEKPATLSTPLTRMMVHKLRSEVQAIMVGTNTAILDNPSLTTRHWTGKSPLRVLVDRNSRVPKNSNLFDGAQQALVFTQNGLTIEDANASETKAYTALNPGYEWKKDEPTHFLRNIITILYKLNINSLLVEGGALLHRSFIEANLWDELIVETAPVTLNNGVKAAEFHNRKGAKLHDRRYINSDKQTQKKCSLVEKYFNFSV